MGEAGQVQYDLTPAELRRGLAWLSRRSPAIRLVRLIVYSAAIALAIANVPAEPTIARGLLVHFFVPVALFELLLRAFGWIALVISYPRELPGFIGYHEIALCEMGIVEKTEVNETTLSWAAISKIVDTKEFILLILTPAAAHIIPKRAFVDPQAETRFLEVARALRAEFAAQQCVEPDLE